MQLLFDLFHLKASKVYEVLENGADREPVIVHHILAPVEKAKT